jgi:Fe-S-cluster containining protein
VLSAPWGDPPPFWPPAPADRAALTDVYRRVEAALSDFSDACRRCGKCCRFEPAGIILFASALEMAHLVSEAGPPPVACHGNAPLRGHAPADFGTHGHAAARGHATPLLDVPWRCPYQEGDLCAAREGRLLGCRTYFCDATARAVGERIHDDALREIRQIAHAAGHRWWYGPAQVCLAAWNSGC